PPTKAPSKFDPSAAPLNRAAAKVRMNRMLAKKTGLHSTTIAAAILSARDSRRRLDTALAKTELARPRTRHSSWPGSPAALRAFRSLRAQMRRTAVILGADVFGDFLAGSKVPDAVDGPGLSELN